MAVLGGLMGLDGLGWAGVVVSGVVAGVVTGVFWVRGFFVMVDVSGGSWRKEVAGAMSSLSGY